MSDLLVNGIDCLRGTLRMPRVGRWTADVTIDTPTPPTGSVTVSNSAGTISLKGTVRRGGAYSEVGHLYIVGGAGGLENEAPPVFFRGVTVRTPLQALLNGLGEVISTTTDPTALNTFLPVWARERGPGGPALARLADAAGATWRVLDDGTIWLGTDTFPESTLTEDQYELTESIPHEFRASLATESIPGSLRPGMTFLGQRVAYVEYSVDTSAVATQVWYERDAPSSHPVLGPMQAIIRDTMRETRYHALFPARVVSQNPDDSVDVILDDPSFPPMTQVPLHKQTPGVKVRASGRVIVAFSGGDPSKPMALLWESGATSEMPVKTCGTISLTAAANVLTFTYTAPDGTSQVVSASFASSPPVVITVTPPTGADMNLSGRIAT